MVNTKLTVNIYKIHNETLCKKTPLCFLNLRAIIAISKLKKHKEFYSMKHILDNYRAGINLGGWISQCRNMTPEHIAEFITEADIKKIASWKMDHVRLPIDYPVIEDEAGYAVIDRLIEWCKKYNLNVILDLHKAPGYSFSDNIISDQKEIPLFADEAMQKRFISIWETFAHRYINERDNVIFELLNEITNPHGESWNIIARKAISAIQAIDPNRYIILGGPFFNSVAGLYKLELWDDEHIIYTFHFYDPFVLTHQRARWMLFKDTGINQPYPGEVAGMDILEKLYPEQANIHRANKTLNKDYLLEKLTPALDFMKQTGKRLYCGEYGVIDNADINSRVNWLSDMKELFDEYKIGRACWTYKGMNFTAINKETGEPVSEAYIKAISL
jgi:aryl-phospho-beta-D-glucosidase BglC (GH1 family)